MDKDKLIPPKPNKDMDGENLQVYNQAVNIFEQSPKAAASLLGSIAENILKSQAGLKEFKKGNVIPILKKKYKGASVVNLINFVMKIRNEGAHSSKMVYSDDDKIEVLRLFGGVCALSLYGEYHNSWEFLVFNYMIRSNKITELKISEKLDYALNKFEIKFSLPLFIFKIIELKMEYTFEQNKDFLINHKFKEKTDKWISKLLDQLFEYYDFIPKDKIGIPSIICSLIDNLRNISHDVIGPKSFSYLFEEFWVWGKKIEENSVIKGFLEDFSQIYNKYHLTKQKKRQSWNNIW